MSQQTTTYQGPGTTAGAAKLVTVATSSTAGETTRAFTARHLDQLEESFAKAPLVVLLHPARNRPIEHRRVLNGQTYLMHVEHKRAGDPVETGEEWGIRALHFLAKYSLSNPADV